jgi:transporter family protein
MVTGWVAPAVGYVLLVGVFGIAAKYGLRQVTWQGLVALTTVAYVVVLAVLAVVGFPFRVSGARASAAFDWTMVAVAAFIAPVTIVLFFVAVTRGPVSRIVPITSVYPLITVVLGALFLSERITWQIAIGVVLIVGGVALLGL